MRELSKDSKIAVCLCLILDSVSPLFYQQCNTYDVENLDWTPHDNNQVSFSESKFMVTPRTVFDSDSLNSERELVNVLLVTLL